ncbi:hypothetical protein D3C81_1237610 [compost metagenome]
MNFGNLQDFLFRYVMAGLQLRSEGRIVIIVFLCQVQQWAKIDSVYVFDNVQIVVSGADPDNIRKADQ